MATTPRPVEVSYEGMGTCIEATIKLGGKIQCVIASPNPAANKATDEIVMLAKNHLIKKEKKRWDDQQKQTTRTS